MPTDTQIHSSQVSPAPLDYTVPLNAEMLLKAVNATFADNGAGGDWLPCLTLISDAGSVIARAVDQGVKVTAGSDAEVSWFPGVKRAAASTGSVGVAFASGNYDSGGNPAFGVSAGTNANQPFYQLTNTDPSVFTWSTTTNHDDTLTLHPAGTYLCFVGYQGGTGGGLGGPIIVPSSVPFATHNYQELTANPAIPGGFATASDYTIIHSTANDYTVQVVITNPSGFNMSVFEVDFYVCYLATGA